MEFWREVLIATVTLGLVAGAMVVPVKHQSALDLLEQMGVGILYQANRRY